MSDFSAKITAQLDTSQIPSQLKQIQAMAAKQKIKLVVDTSEVKNINQVTNAFSDLMKLQTQINSTRVKLAGLDATKDTAQIKELSGQLNHLMTDYNNLYSTFSRSFSTNQIDALNRGFDTANNKIAALNAKAADTSGLQQLTSSYERLKNIVSQMNSIQLKLGSLDADKNSSQITELTSQLRTLYNEYNNLRNSLNGSLSSEQLSQLGLSVQEARNKLAELDAKAQDTQRILAEAINVKVSDGTFEASIAKVTAEYEKLATTGHSSLSEVRQDIESLTQLQRQMQTASNSEDLIATYEQYNNTLKKVKNTLSTISAESKTFASSLQMTKLDNKMSTWLEKNSKAAKDYGASIQSLREQLAALMNSGTPVQSSAVAAIDTQFQTIQQQAISEGKTGATFGARLKGSLQSISSYLSTTTLIYTGIRGLKDMYENVSNIDSAMVELKKVTNETDEAYDKFLSGTNERAQTIGTTITGLVNSTADFARLGYTFDESEQLAETANIYAVVGDEVADVDTATQSIISTMKAFDIPVEDSISIVDKFNEVGNNFAISSGGIGDAMQRSASSMRAANNTIDETIALITAANTVVQDPDSVGTAFKTVSMRIRGAKTELESAGLDADNMAESTAKLREEIMALSGVDIMQDEETFKSTYQIMDELARKWDDLTDIQQASITELIAGKRQGNIVSSLMENFQEARDALEVSMNSEGSAMTEHEKWLDSIEAKQQQLKASWEGLSQDFLSSDFLKMAIDALRGLVNVIDAVVQALGNLGTVFAGVSAIGLKKFIGNNGLKGLLSVASALPTPLLAVAAAATAVGVGIYAAKKHYDNTKLGKYLEEDTEKIKECADNITELNSLSSEVEELELIINTPTSTQEEIDNAQSRLQEIADLLNQEYNLNISADTDELERTLKLLTASERSEMMSEVDNYTYDLKKTKYSDAKQDYATATQKVEDLEWIESAVKSLNDRKNIIDDITDSAEQNTQRYELLLDAKEIYEEIEEKGYGDLVQSWSWQDYSTDWANIDSELTKAKNVITDYDTTIDNAESSAQKAADYLAQVLASDVSLDDTYSIDTDIAKFEQIGKTLKEVGIDTDYLSQQFAISKTGFTQLSDAISSGNLNDVVDNYLSIKEAIGETSENAVRGAAVIKQGFSDISEITPNSINAIYEDMKALGEQEGVTDYVENALEGTSLLAAGFKTVEEAVAAGDTGIADVLSNVAKLKEYEGVFSDDMDVSEKSEQLTEFAHQIGLLPDDKTVHIDVETGEVSVITDITKEIESKWGGSDTKFNVTVNTDVQGENIEDFEKEIDALDNKDCSITFNVDGTPAKATIGDVTYQLEDYDNTTGTATLVTDDGEALASIDLLTGKIDLIPKYTTIKISAETGTANLVQGEGSISAGLEEYAKFINNQNIRGGINFQIDAEGNVDVLDKANEIIAQLEKDSSIVFHINTEGNLEVLDSATNKIQVLNKYGQVEVVTEAEVRNFGEVQGLTGTLENLNGQEYSVSLDANNEPLTVKIGDSIYQLNDYDAATGTATITAENGDALAIIKVTNGAISAIPDKDIEVTANGNDNGVSEIKDTIDNTNDKTVTLTANTQDNGVSGLSSTWNSIQSKTVYLTTVAQSTVGGQLASTAISNYKNNNGAGVDGTAFLNGTTGKAFKSGNWGTNSNGIALGGELGEELVVRNGKFFTIGSQSAEFFKYKKDDIIFNAEQTKQIFEKGKITHGSRRGKAFSSGTAFADGSDTSEETFDWVETFSDRVERIITRYTDKFQSSYLTLANRFTNLGYGLDETIKQIGFKQQAYDRYMEQANAVGLDESWAAKVRDGEFDISTVTDEDLKEKIENYQEWYEKALDCTDAIDELHESVADFYKDNFDNIESAYDNILTSIEHRGNLLNTYIDRAEERGLLGSTRYYEALKKSETENLNQLEDKRTDLINALNDAIDSGEIEVYSDAWYEMQNNIDGVTESIEESKNALIEFDNEMRQITWDRFDYLQDSISNFIDESDFLIDLLGDDNLYDDGGQLNERGLSVLGLHGVNYDTYMAQAASYAQEIADIEEEISENGGDDNLIQRKQELLEAQRDCILAANDEKEAMIELVEDGIEEQIDALKDLIDAYTDSLDSAKDLYDYQQKVKESTDDIASLEKQLAAYQNDTSEETKATVQKLKVELEEAKQDLQDTEYDKYISDQEELLNSLYEEYETLMNAKLDDIDETIEELIDEVNDNSSTINKTLTKETSKVGATLSNEMKSVWTSQSNALTSYFGSGGIILDNVSGYFTNTNTSLTGINSTLTSIMDGVNDIVAYASYQAAVDVDPEGSLNQMIQNSLDWYATDSESVRSSLESENESYGEAFGYTKSDGSWYDSSGNLVYSISDDDKIRNIISKMKANSEAWSSASASERTALESANESYAAQIQSLTGQSVYKDGNGVWWIGNEELYSYKSGGLADFTGAAWLDGTKSEPELVLNAEDTQNFIALKDALKNISGQGISIGDLGYSSALSVPQLSGVSDVSSMLQTLSQSSDNNGGTTVGDIEINIPIERVDDYNDFISQLQKDNQFEKFIRSISVDLLSGGSTLAKNKYKW